MQILTPANHSPHGGGRRRSKCQSPNGQEAILKLKIELNIFRDRQEALLKIHNPRIVLKYCTVHYTCICGLIINAWRQARLVTSFILISLQNFTLLTAIWLLQIPNYESSIFTNVRAFVEYVL